MIDGASSASPFPTERIAFDELLRRDVLEQEAAGSGAERVVDVLVHVEGRQHHDLRLGRAVGEEPARRLDAVELRHAHVHQHDVRREPLPFGDRLEPVRGFADDLDVLLRFEDHAEARAHECLVVDDQDAQAHSAVTGSRARSSNPPSGRGPAASSPP